MSRSRQPRDRRADGLFVQAALRELCGGRTPPAAERVLAADAERRAQASRNLDAARRLLARNPVRRLFWPAAALLLLAGGAALAWPAGHAARDRAVAPLLWSQSATELAGEGAATGPSARYQEFLDRFHRVMPRRPTELRDVAARRRIAPVALPVLRQIDEFLQQRAEAEPSGRSAQAEFRIYALALGDDWTRARVQQLAATDPAAAALLGAAAELIAADGAVARAAALRRLQALLAAPSPFADAAVRCVAIAGGLDAVEAASLAEAAADPRLATRLRELADWAARDPRQLLGQPLVVEGSSLAGGRCSTADLRGRVVAVHFWSSSSVQCDFALPQLLALRIRHPDSELAILGVSCDADPQALREHLQRHPEIGWPQLYDLGQPGWHALARKLGVSAVPRVFLLDRRGVLRSVDAQDDLTAAVERLLRD